MAHMDKDEKGKLVESHRRNVIIDTLAESDTERMASSKDSGF